MSEGSFSLGLCSLWKMKEAVSKCRYACLVRFPSGFVNGSRGCSSVNYGSPVKCVDTFRIALTDEPELCVKQIDSQDGLGYLLYYYPPMQKTFTYQYFENADNRLKNHDIISDKTPTDKGKNTHKKQVCNQQ